MAGLTDPPDRTTTAFQSAKQDIRLRALAAGLTLWDQLVNGPDDTTADRWVDTWAPQRTAGSWSVAALTDAYVDSFLEAHGVTPVGGIDPDDIVAQVRPGVPDEDLAMRPLKQVRLALAEGSDLGGALRRGRQRLESIEATDIQQSFRIAYRDRIAQEPQIRSYRRVLHGSENCALCVVASAQRYRSSKLMPIHPGCDCGVEPLVGPTDRGPTIDRDRLDQVKQLLDEQGISYGDRAQLANTKIRINLSSVDDLTEVPHGELGPILAVKQHRNTDLGDLPSWVRRSRREFDPTGRRTR